MKKRTDSASRRAGLILATAPIDLASANGPDDRAGSVSVLGFEIGDREFAIGVEHTEGVVDCPRVSPLPAAPEGVIGVASVRGRMTLVMDLSAGAHPRSEKRRLILLKGDAQLGLLADRVGGVLALAPETLRTGEPRKSKKGSKVSWPTRAYFARAGRRVSVLDVERLNEA
jgi:purine-binding chemotaxis protein CheW